MLFAILSDALRATLVVLVASAIAVSATQSLSVKVAGAPAVTGVDNLIVKTTITNTGDEILTLLNHPESPLSKLPANTFTITDPTGASPTFTGIKVKYVPAAAIAAGKDALTVLAPGHSVEVEHNLSEAYAFSKGGEYAVASKTLFYAVNDQNQAVPIQATVEPHTAKLIGKLSVRRVRQDKRATFNGCSASQQSSLVTAASNAQVYTTQSQDYLNKTTNDTPRFDTWFGRYTDNSKAVTSAIFNKISGNNFSSYTYDCACTAGHSDVFAYVYPDIFGEVHICGAFWKSPPTGSDSQAGCIVHESTHFTSNGGTDDYAYGQANAKSLAQNKPSEAVANADNYEYFAENTPSLS